MTPFQPKLVLVEFLDHACCQGNEAQDACPITCEAIGLLHKEDARAYYIASWIAAHTIDHNTEQFVILKSTVTRMTTLIGEKHRGKAKKRKASKA